MILDLVRPSHGPLAGGLRWDGWVILALIERMMQVDLFSTAFLIPMLIRKMKLGRNLVKNSVRLWPMGHPGSTLVCVKMAEQFLKSKVEAQ